MAHVIEYRPDGAVLRRFLRDTQSRVKVLLGPLGSGKSVACCFDLVRSMAEQQPGPDGLRRSRYLVVRNTGPELRMTTIATWLSWFPDGSIGKFIASPPLRYLVEYGDIRSEVLFFPLDDPEATRSIRSLDLTGAWINEAREIDRRVWDQVDSRIDRPVGGMRAVNPQLIADTNAPDEHHWLAVAIGDAAPPEWWSEADREAALRPKSWTIYRQPPAVFPVMEGGKIIGWQVNPEAENLANVGARYYERMTEGKTKAWIDAWLRVQVNRAPDGDPVWPQFDEEEHVARETLQVVDAPLEIGMDFGLTPAAVIAQTVGGQRRYLAECVSQDMPATVFCQRLLLPALAALKARHPRGHKAPVRGWGDPAGDQRVATDAKTPFEIVRAHGVPIFPAPTNDFQMRVNAVADMLLRRIDRGMPAILIDPSCQALRMALRGGYRFRHMRLGKGEVRRAPMPEKNMASHIAEAFGYHVIGSGGGAAMLGRDHARRRPVTGSGPTNPLGRYA